MQNDTLARIGRLAELVEIAVHDLQGRFLDVHQGGVDAVGVDGVQGQLLD